MGNYVGRMTRHARRVVVTVIGGTLVLTGVVLLVFPGPGLLLIAAGLAVLGTEFDWAKSLLTKAKAKLDTARERGRRRRARNAEGDRAGAFEDDARKAS